MSEIKVGQIWRRLDGSYSHVRVEAVRAKVFIRTVRQCEECGWIDAPFSQVKYAKASRFNGKPGGYELVEDAP